MSDKDTTNKTEENNYTEINEEEINAIKKNIFELKKKSKTDLIEDLYDFIEIFDQKNYQKKMKGFINPFSSEKINGRGEGQLKGIVKFDAATSENIKKIIKERKQQKIEKIEKIEKLKSQEGKKKIILKNKDKNIFVKEKAKLKYADIQRKQNNITKEKETKLTWDQVENLNFNHFVTDRDDDFKPYELLDKENDSDDENIFDTSGEKTLNNYSSQTKATMQGSDLNTNSNVLNVQANSNLINIQSGFNLPNNNILYGSYTENNNAVKSNLNLDSLKFVALFFEYFLFNKLTIRLFSPMPIKP